MMSNEEKFSMYFLNEMDQIEKQKFEDQLNTSEQLRKEYEDYKKVFDLVQQTKNIGLNNEYSQKVIPAFRNKLEKKQKKSLVIKYGYVFAVLFFAVVSYSVVDKMININDENQNVYTGITPEEARGFADEMNINFENDYDEQANTSIDSLYSDAINENVKNSIDNNGIESIPKDLSINELDKYLSEDDVNLIFAELSDKEILKR